MGKKSDKIKNLRELVLSELERIGNEISKHPRDVTRSELVNNSDKVTDYMLRKLPGLPQIKAVAYPFEKDYKAKYETAETSSYISKLEKKLGEKESLEDIFKKEVISKIKPLKVKVPKLKAKPKKSNPRHVVAMLNDLHIGLKVDPAEVGNLNEFNFTIASRRISYFIQQVCNYKKHRRNEHEVLHLLLNGDNVAGLIHNLMGNDLEMLTHQFNGAVHILSQVIALVAQEYKHVKVYNLGGNHSDHLHRREHGKRVSSQVYDNLESQIFYALSVAHSKTSNVEFLTTKDIYQDIQLPSGRAIMSHGHLMFAKQIGNPGTSINVKGLGTAIGDWNASQRRMGKEEAKLVLLGHSHVMYNVITKDNVHVYGAPSLCGIDSYAYSIGVTNNCVGQVLFESTNDYIMGDTRLVMVNEADKDASMDKVITPYKYELTYRKK